MAAHYDEGDTGHTDDPVVGHYDPQSPARREFLRGAGATAVAASAGLTLTSTSAVAQTASPLSPIQLQVNSRDVQIAVDARWTLAELLRDHLDLTGTKIGCNRSECGACTVLLNGLPVYSCSQLAVWADGASVQTVEGLAPAGQLSRLQQAFVDNNGPQCGFCTSGQLMTATALLRANASPDAEQVRTALVGNLCRCSNYMAIVDAVVKAGAPVGGEA